jgi:hypothetical protein
VREQEVAESGHQRLETN